MRRSQPRLEPWYAPPARPRRTSSLEHTRAYNHRHSGVLLAETKHRRGTTLILLSTAVFVLLALLIGLNAFNVRALTPQTTGQIVLLTSVSVLVFLLFVTVLVLLLRNLFKLLAEQRSQVLGARLRTRMFIGALLVSLVPALFMFLFSFLLMNRSIDRWFSQPALDVRDDSTRIASELSHYASLNARAEAESMAQSPGFSAALRSGNPQAILDEMRNHQITLQGGFAVLYRDSAAVAAYQLPQSAGAAEVRSWINDDDHQSIDKGQPLASAILKAAQRSDEPMLAAGGSEYALGLASLPGGGVVVAGLPMPAGLNAIMANLSAGTSQYWALYRERRVIRMTYFLLLLMLTALVFFASSWLALNVSRQMTGPLEALADATVEIGKGDYSHRVTVEATAEMAELVRCFNHMAADLEQSRMLADRSARELSAANLAIEARRKELETILETIPSGVVTLDASRRIVLGNRAFAELIRLEGQPDLSGVLLDSLLPPEFTEELMRLERRARRMGTASSEFELHTLRGEVNLSVTLAALDPHNGQGRGSILVLEDVSDFLHAQRQAAWKEVAQRVAHEIRNPLTPITLSAERIRRHVDRSAPESPGVIRKCCDVILGSVETMRTLVGQFAALAEFPVAHPQTADLNEIVESAVMLFEGRIQSIRVEKHLDPTLPPVMADPEALRRALANLIDNAAEAMQDSLLRVLSIETGAGERRGMAEIVVADTGPGITPDMRERLFLPWFSTRQRGTGLGLSIVAKIVQDHGGSIRTENNVPAGARFIIELPLAETNGVDRTTASLTRAV
jgi:two-component system, NtrC family, nitrogen regulation sensor histidine kinase NtrY